MSRKKLVVPEARKALEELKLELANEFSIDDPRNLASKHTGLIVRKLVEMGEGNLISKK